MSKTRIHELAKELNIANKDLIDKAHEMGLDVKNHMSTLEDQEISKLKGRFMKSASVDKTESVKNTQDKPQASAESKSQDQAKPEKHHKIIYDRTKEIREEENRRQNKSYDNRNSDNRSYDNRNGDNRSNENRSSDNRSGDNRSYDNRNRNNSYSNNANSNNNNRNSSGSGNYNNTGERKPYNNNRNYDNRNRTGANGEENRDNTTRENTNRPYGDNQRSNYQKPYNRDENKDGERPQYNRDNQKPYNRENRDGERPQYNREGQRPYNRENKDGERPQYNRDGQKPYNREYKEGERPQYNRDGQRPPYNKDGQKPPYNKDFKDRKPRENDGTGYNRSYEKRPYDPNRPNDGSKPNYENRGYNKPRTGPDGKPYDSNRPRNDQGGYNKPKSFGGGFNKDKDYTPGQGRKTDNTKTTFTETEIAEKTPKKRKPKKDKIVVTFDTDKLESKSKKTKKLLKEELSVTDAENRRQFDFGKKKKQKGVIYKEKSEKERTTKLNEQLTQDIVYVPEEMTVKQFAEIINKPSTDVIMKLMALGKMATLNQLLDFAAAEALAIDYGIVIEQEVVEEENQFEIFDLDTPDEVKDLKKRAPVVTVMGHVDHGKTSLLDAIRNTGVASGEAGGITQHIGASEIVHRGEKIVFLDTPGHEAFTSLRARGAKVTDVAILVVAADDGVMPQTIEAIDHSKAANVPIIVAINKMDKPGANPDRVKQELSERGVVIEEWGGDVIAVPVSAKTGEGLDTLLEMILLVSEVLELKANPNRPGVGTVIEAKVVKGRGTVASIIIENGTMSVGDVVVAGTTSGRIKAMYNDKGKKVKQVGPSSAIEIDGLSEIPQAGEKIYVTPDEKTARTIADRHALAYREKTLNKNQGVTLEDLFSRIKDGGMKDLNIIIKADVHGSVEAIKQSLLKLSNDEVRVNIIRADVGAISESDVILASASSAIIIGFNVRPSAIVSTTADNEGVDIRTYQIIYNAINDVETAMKGMLDPLYKEVILGRIQVRATFKIPSGVIAGGYVTSGKVTRNAQVRVIREGIVINEGKISSLKRFKDDVKEVAQGYECGIGIEKFNDLKELDEIEAFIMEEVKR